MGNSGNKHKKFKMKKVSEKSIEPKLRKFVQSKGGMAIKLVAVSFTGLPDRLILLSGGRACFAETKSTGKGLSPRQIVVKALLERLGFVVWVIDGNEALDEFKKSVQ